MTSLRARLVILLMVAITAVAVLAAVVTYKIVGGPARASFDRTFAQEARIVSDLLQGSDARARAVGIRVGPPPEPRTVIAEQTDHINAELGRQQSDILVAVVSDPTGDVPAHLAVPLGGEAWAYLDFPNVPPSGLRPLAAYLAFVVLGSIAVAIIVADKIVQPLKLLERAIASIGPDGEIRRLDEKGPAEVRATAAALNRLSQRLKHAMDSRMRLVAAAGHDLRTPMTRMRLRAEFLPPEEQETWLRDLEELDRIADSAIRLVREEVAGGDEAQSVSLDAVVRDIGSELCEIGRTVEWTAASGLLVSGRQLALKRALRNLVDNAATHGGGASVRVRRDGEAALVEIDDEGPGIPEHLLSRVFEPFFRVDVARRQSHPGAGLGFAIAREIVDQAGGSIAIENRPGGGLRQSVRLTLAPSAA